MQLTFQELVDVAKRPTAAGRQRQLSGIRGPTDSRVTVRSNAS